MNSARLLRTLVAATVFVSGTAVATVVRPGIAAAETVTRTAFSDAFDGDRGASPDAARWAAADDAWLDGEGRLLLGDSLRTAKTFSQKYGHAEARIKVRREPGAWRALGVLDEAGQIPRGTVETLADDQVDADDFHTYAIDWTPTSLVWSVDGTQVIRFTPEAGGKPFFLTLNLASEGRRSAMMLVEGLTVTVQVTVVTPSTPWKKFTAYKAGQVVSYQGSKYRVRERHTSLPGWQPDLVPALFQKV